MELLPLSDHLNPTGHPSRITRRDSRGELRPNHFPVRYLQARLRRKRVFAREAVPHGQRTGADPDAARSRFVTRLGQKIPWAFNNLFWVRATSNARTRSDTSQVESHRTRPTPAAIRNNLFLIGLMRFEGY